MIHGVDISNHNLPQTYDGDFVIMKASEGNGWKDKLLESHFNNLNPNQVYGFYHYARPDLGNTPEAEAEWFIECIRKYLGSCVMALDWEQESLNYSPDWALRFLEHVYKLTNVRPLLYIQASEENSGKYNKIRDKNYGLWIAHWGVESPSVKHWAFWAIWQYQGSPLDSNYFNGTKENLKKYGTPDFSQNQKPVEKPTQPPKNEIKVGDRVRVRTTTDYNGVVNDAWVLGSTFIVMEAIGDRIVIGNGVAITGVWKKDNLTKL